MKNLTTIEIEQVSGSFLNLLAALAAVFVFPKVFNDHRKEYNQWGHDLGETLYEYNYPYDPNNPTGIYK